MATRKSRNGGTAQRRLTCNRYSTLSLSHFTVSITTVSPTNMPGTLQGNLNYGTFCTILCNASLSNDAQMYFMVLWFKKLFYKVMLYASGQDTYKQRAAVRGCWECCWRIARNWMAVVPCITHRVNYPHNLCNCLLSSMFPLTKTTT